MKYEEKMMNLFSVGNSYYLAHCISADFGMGKGIVVEFNRRFSMKQLLQTKYPNYLSWWDNAENKGDCLPEGQVFNLITKRNYWLKPTYQTLTNALIKMKALCVNNDIYKIAMPIIGCGLDKLEWDKVSQIIKDIFADTDIEILVCKQ